jgi:hypothetical protein
MKKLIVGFIAGFIFATAGAVYADEGLQKVEAYLRPSLPITLDGKSVTLESPPVVYDGSTYLKLRDLAKLTGLQVNWNDATQTVELGTSGVNKLTTQATGVIQETNYQGIKAININGVTYFSPSDYNQKFNDEKTFKVNGKSLKIKKKSGEEFDLNTDDADAIQVYNGESYINVKYYPE